MYSPRSGLNVAIILMLGALIGVAIYLLLLTAGYVHAQEIVPEGPEPVIEATSEPVISELDPITIPGDPESDTPPIVISPIPDAPGAILSVFAIGAAAYPFTQMFIWLVYGRLLALESKIGPKWYQIVNALTALVICGFFYFGSAPPRVNILEILNFYQTVPTAVGELVTVLFATAGETVTWAFVAGAMHKPPAILPVSGQGIVGRGR